MGFSRQYALWAANPHDGQRNPTTSTEVPLERRRSGLSNDAKHIAQLHARAGKHGSENGTFRARKYAPEFLSAQKLGARRVRTAGFRTKRKVPFSLTDAHHSFETDRSKIGPLPRPPGSAPGTPSRASIAYAIRQMLLYITLYRLFGRGSLVQTLLTVVVGRFSNGWCHLKEDVLTKRTAPSFLS